MSKYKLITYYDKQFRVERPVNRCLSAQDCKTITADTFTAMLRQYSRSKKLTQRMLNDLVERIEVFQAEKVDGVWQQRLRIHYQGIGTIEIPNQAAIPDCEVSMLTRKGVNVAYSSLQNATAMA